jgi:hypothetical protein
MAAVFLGSWHPKDLHHFVTSVPILFLQLGFYRVLDDSNTTFLAIDTGYPVGLRSGLLGILAPEALDLDNTGRPVAARR